MSATKPSAISEQRTVCLSIHDAVRAGDVTALMSLTRSGSAVNVNDVDPDYSFTPLHLAAQDGRLECLHWLLWQGAEPSRQSPQGWTPAHLAAIRGQRACLEALIVNGVDLSVPDQRGCTPVHLASAHGHPDILQTLLRTGAEPDRASSTGWVPLHYAAFHGRLGCVQVLTRWSGSLDATDHNGNTPVHLAAAEGHVLCLKFLVLKGGGLARTLQARNNEGENPRDLAVRFLKHPVLQCLEELSQHTDSPEEEDEFPAHTAAFHGDLVTLRKLLECGTVNINETDQGGSTIMHKSSGQGHLTCLRWLVEMGADHRIKNNAGETPRDTAQRFGQLAAVRMLGQASSEEDDEGQVTGSRCCQETMTAAQRRQGRERARQRLEELKTQVEIARSNYRQLGGELEEPDKTDPEREAQSLLQDLQAQLERERERRERLETQLDDHRAQIRKLEQARRNAKVSKDIAPCLPIIEKKKTTKKKANVA
ncbi:ankyrin repeat domain-containing protein 42-like [Hypomesus transpacificus]|uniref:ankyrin repeat domain-containing protein 42-like n=1 Tax=Hypomesus transpacificus TaxID=137520 RepID=UPI001F084379|nr:ankyrin repeat domain-containing protein 42-like [Hypomesus transpacificus]